MVINIVKRVVGGISCGAILTFIALTIMMLTDTEGTVGEIWLNMLASMFLGVYFALAGFIFEYDKWSPLKQLIIHFFLSLFVWLPIATYVGWIEIKPSSLLLGLVIFIIIYTIFWLSFRYYFRKQAEALNNSVRRK